MWFTWFYGFDSVEKSFLLALLNTFITYELPESLSHIVEIHICSPYYEKCFMIFKQSCNTCVTFCKVWF